MSDRESFSLLLGGAPSHEFPPDLHLATAFKDGTQTMISLSRNPLTPDDSDNEQKWKEWDPRHQPSPFPFDPLALAPGCRCRTPQSKLRLHDLDADAFLAYIQELINAGGGVARFVVELENFDKSDDGGLLANRITFQPIEKG